MLAQAAETVSNGVDGAVIGAWVAAGAALLSIPVNLRMSHNRLKQAREESAKRMEQEKDLHRELLDHEAQESEKRLAHEVEMLGKRLVHERREVLKVTAARALNRTLDFIRLYRKWQVQRVSVDQSEIRAAGADSGQALFEISAWGWTDELKAAAEQMEVVLSFLPYRSDESPLDDDREDRKYREAYIGALNTLNDFRKAMALEVSE